MYMILSGNQKLINLTLGQPKSFLNIYTHVYYLICYTIRFSYLNYKWLYRIQMFV